MKSALRASRLRAVSLRVSPFLSEEASAVKLMISAESRCSASSKLIRVRVEGSTNKLTTVLPRKAGTFLMARSPTALKARAVSSTVVISSAESDSMSRRCLRFQLMRGLCLFEDYFVLPAGFSQVDVNTFGLGGWNVFADEISLDGELAVSTVYQNGQLDALGAAKVV